MATLTAGELARLGRMAGEAHKATEDRMLDDARLDEIAGEVALMRDADGLTPIDIGYTTTVDLYRAAAAAWNEKASMVADGFDFRAEGATFSRSQVYDHYVRQAGRYAGMAAQLSMATESAFGLPDESTGAFQDYLDDGGGLPA